MDVPDIRLKRTPFRLNRGSLHTWNKFVYFLLLKWIMYYYISQFYNNINVNITRFLRFNRTCFHKSQPFLLYALIQVKSVQQNTVSPHPPCHEQSKPPSPTGRACRRSDHRARITAGSALFARSHSCSPPAPYESP